MKARAGIAIMAALTIGGVPAANAGTRGAPQAELLTTSDATDVGARSIRTYRGPIGHPAYARSQAPPAYFARPYYYRPYPYSVPAPFFLGFGYLPRD